MAVWVEHVVPGALVVMMLTRKIRKKIMTINSKNPMSSQLQQGINICILGKLAELKTVKLFKNGLTPPLPLKSTLDFLNLRSEVEAE